MLRTRKLVFNEEAAEAEDACDRPRRTADGQRHTIEIRETSDPEGEAEREFGIVCLRGTINALRAFWEVIFG